MTEPAADSSGFTAMGLDPQLANALGYAEPSPIQSAAIPPLLEGKDLVGLAGTGTGKTAAFTLPILHRLRSHPPAKSGVAILILTPTRELAIQVARAVKTYGKPMAIDVLAVYGGTGYGEQIRAIRRGARVVVATPGRALDLIKNGQLPLDTIGTVVLDEADEMLNMGFAEDIEAILSQTPKERQTALFSATMPPHIETIAKKHLRDPIRIKVETPKATSEQAARVTQVAYVVQREYKAKALGRILEIEQPNSAILFCRTRSDADELVETLAHRGFKPLALHGGLAQPQRDRVMNLFRSGGANLLVATDIAARGLDISHLSHVVNFDLPADPDSYVHRIGRVGRAGRAGVALTFVAPREQHALNFIERRTGLRITVAPVPSAGDLKAARLDRLRRQLRDSLAATPADDLKAMVAELAKESSAADVAAAALSLLRTPAKPDDELDIPSGVAPRVPRPERGPRFERGPDRGFDERHRAGRRPTNRGMAKVFFGIGRDSGVVPRDLVGAIANEAGIPGKDLGAIDLTDRFALVEVPHDLAGYVVEAMQGVRIRGRRVNVRPDRPPTGEI